MRRLPASRLPVPPGMTPSAHVGADQRRRGLHRGAVAAEDRDDVHPLAPRRTRPRPLRVARAAGREHLGAPARAAQGAHDRLDRALLGAGGGGVGDEQRTRHLELPLPEDVEADLVAVLGRAIGVGVTCRVHDWIGRLDACSGASTPG